jgi:hypothetical protein
MAILSLYVHPRGQLTLHRQGFSWLAAIHPALWALHRRMWLTAIAVTLLIPHVYGWVFKAIHVLPPGKLPGLLSISWLLLCAVIWGAFANRGHRKYLELRGYRLMAVETEETIPHEGIHAK